MTYNVWSSMIQRCHNPKNTAYPYYGGRGITVCDRWRKSFVAFLADVGERPSRGYTLDRHPDKNGHYEPGNVRWATRKVQQRNMRSNRLITFRGEVRSVAEWSEHFGLNKSTLFGRLFRYGWPVERALTEPVMG